MKTSAQHDTQHAAGNLEAPFPCGCPRCMESAAALKDRIHVLERSQGELLEALKLMTPNYGFPKCDRRCASIAPTPEDDPRCDCGLEEVRDNAEVARTAIANAECKP